MFGRLIGKFLRFVDAKGSLVKLFDSYVVCGRMSLNSLMPRKGSLGVSVVGEVVMGRAGKKWCEAVVIDNSFFVL